VSKSEMAEPTNKKYRIIIPPLFLPSNEAHNDYQLQPPLATIPFRSVKSLRTFRATFSDQRKIQVKSVVLSKADVSRLRDVISLPGD
jgi:hypothetical protein